MQYIALFAFITCNFHVYKWKKAYIKDLNAIKNFHEFFMYLYR